MNNKRIVTVEEVEVLLDDLSVQVSGLNIRPRGREQVLRIYGVPRGGIPVVMGLVRRLPDAMPCTHVHQADIIIDDIYDSGKTFERYGKVARGIPFLAMVDKREPGWQGQWVVLPWEVSDSGNDASAHDIVTRLFEYIGEDPTREGLRDTPMRVLKGWGEWAQGYGQDPHEVLKTFTDGAEDCGDELVVVHNIPVISKCEHHLADVLGFAHVGYIPDGKIVGLSKLARVVDLYARRLQVQERMTNQIANAIQEVLSPKGVGVIVRASHACMSTRGVRVQDSWTTTSAMRGALLEKPAARAEFLALCAAGGMR